MVENVGEKEKKGRKEKEGGERNKGKKRGRREEGEREERREGRKKERERNRKKIKVGNRMNFPWQVFLMKLRNTLTSMLFVKLLWTQTLNKTSTKAIFHCTKGQFPLHNPGRTHTRIHL